MASHPRRNNRQTLPETLLRSCAILSLAVESTQSGAVSGRCCQVNVHERADLRNLAGERLTLSRHPASDSLLLAPEVLFTGTCS